MAYSQNRGAAKRQREAGAHGFLNAANLVRQRFRQAQRKQRQYRRCCQHKQPEDTAPAENRADITAGQRPEHRPDQHDHDDDREPSGHLRWRIQIAQDRPRNDEAGTATDRLHNTTDDELACIGGDCAQATAQQEHEDARQHDRPSAVAIRHGAGKELRDAGRQHEQAKRQLDRLARYAKVIDQRRQHRQINLH